MGDLANRIYGTREVRAIDARAGTHHGLPGPVLMARAAEAVVAVVRQRWPQATRWLVLCGAGNNAGDGYLVARLGAAAGVAVRVVALVPGGELRGDAAAAAAAFAAAGGRAEPFTGALPPADVVVDALLGTGLTRPVTGAFAAAIAAVNAQPAPVVAVDIPSGIDGDTGAVRGVAIRAAVTVTFVARKAGLYLAAGPDHAGFVLLDDLGIPDAAHADAGPRLQRYASADLAAALPPRRAGAHKGDFGHVLVVGGNHGMGGAVRLAGEAALRAGAGLVTVATRPAHAAQITALRPELMTLAVDAPGDLDRLMARASVIAIGPGLGQDAWAHDLLARVCAAGRPLVLDADALNVLAAVPATSEDWILTPHPGEAARLLGTSTGEVQADRSAALAALARRYGGVVTLKGRGTLVGRADEIPWLIDAGNPGMATAGMGDLLTGITAGLLAQLPGRPLVAAAAAAYAHAVAGDAAAGSAPRGLIAGDVLAVLRPVLNPLPT